MSDERITLHDGMVLEKQYNEHVPGVWWDRLAAEVAAHQQTKRDYQQMQDAAGALNVRAERAEDECEWLRREISAVAEHREKPKTVREQVLTEMDIRQMNNRDKQILMLAEAIDALRP